MGPASLYRQLRMRYGHWLIENTDRPAPTCNEAVFADCAHFSRPFRTPTVCRPSTRRLQPQRSRQRRYRAGTGFRVAAGRLAAHPWGLHFEGDQAMNSKISYAVAVHPGALLRTVRGWAEPATGGSDSATGAPRDHRTAQRRRRACKTCRSRCQCITQHKRCSSSTSRRFRRRHHFCRTFYDANTVRARTILHAGLSARLAGQPGQWFDGRLAEWAAIYLE